MNVIYIQSSDGAESNYTTGHFRNGFLQLVVAVEDIAVRNSRKDDFVHSNAADLVRIKDAVAHFKYIRHRVGRQYEIIELAAVGFRDRFGVSFENQQ